LTHTSELDYNKDTQEGKEEVAHLPGLMMPLTLSRMVSTLFFVLKRPMMLNVPWRQHHQRQEIPSPELIQLDQTFRHGHALHVLGLIMSVFSSRLELWVGLMARLMDDGVPKALQQELRWGKNQLLQVWLFSFGTTYLKKVLDNIPERWQSPVPHIAVGVNR
jgi:hypothetical protein